jgi:cytochrome c-type biogenesis protein CcmE
MKRTFIGLSILILLTSISTACENTTVSAIVADPHKSDGKEVCVEGSVSTLKFKTSKRGNPYTTFSVNDENRKSLNVFSHGTLSIQEGDEVKVTGRFDIEKKVGKYTFYNEIDASSVEKSQ